MVRSALWAAAAAAVLACGTAEASSSVSRPTTLVTRNTVVALAVDGARVAVRVSLKLKSGVVCDSALFWRPGGKVSRIPKRGCDFDAPSSAFDSLTLARTRLVWVDHVYGNFSYCYGPFTATLKALKPVRIPNGVCDRLDGGQDSDWDFAGTGNFWVARSYEYCDDCETGPPNQEDNVKLYSLTGGRFAKLASLPNDTRLEDAEDGQILLRQGATLQVVDTHGKPQASVQLAKPPTAALLSGNDLVAAVAGSLLTYDPATGALRATWAMATGGRFRGLAGGRALYVVGNDLHLLRLSDGQDTVVATVPGLAHRQAHPQLTRAGLFYVAKNHRGGRVTFVPTAQLPA